jgi:hypothetical protein
MRPPASAKPEGYVPNRTSARTRAGRVTEKKIAVGPPSESPKTAGRSMPAASMTASTSSARCSSVGTPVTGSDRPVPALSKIASRANDVIRSRNDLIAGCAQKNSMCETNDGTSTISTSPSPTTW